jgi:hypothetical protein
VEESGREWKRVEESGREWKRVEESGREWASVRANSLQLTLEGSERLVVSIFSSKVRLSLEDHFLSCFGQLHELNVRRKERLGVRTYMRACVRACE